MGNKKRLHCDTSPVRTIAELLEESKKLERRGRELIEQVKALASELAELNAGGGNRRRKHNARRAKPVAAHTDPPPAAR